MARESRISISAAVTSASDSKSRFTMPSFAVARALSDQNGG
jgi:hypothetical protein